MFRFIQFVVKEWFDIDPAYNTKVYVSNLPLDITQDEFVQVMSKCGMIMRDPNTQKYKVKLYTDSNGQIKGDGLCDYIKVSTIWTLHRFCSKICLKLL